jgi:hypothetical protein
MSLLFFLITGCASAKYQKEVAVPMLIQENRQLEDELFFTKEQLDHCGYENQQLRQQFADLQSKSEPLGSVSSNSGKTSSVSVEKNQAQGSLPVWSPRR